MQKTMMAFLFCLAGSIAHAQEVIDLNKPLKCSDAQAVVKYFADTHKEKPVWVGKSVHNTRITLMVNKETGSWTMIEYDDRLACVLGAGEENSSSSNKVF